ncbi:MAG: hypothetical protein ABS45_01510 [Comamonas sp. SCN 65-56]|uniref:type III secretion apparatus assembly protein SctX n=1 Tax=Comamonas sp. SCN 65-56 TaxID=1660095 RepID=UPI00086D056B|nr:hypothetical protein [Comamonas sp. SCN 65-56]ODS93673.1 MAG: hypothetical protein ABS45_01510 [Comamonas sp. SCN 65-56]
MDHIPLSHLSFDRGIERITYSREDTPLELPAREQAAPPDIDVQPELQALLSLPTLDDSLNAALRPQLANRELLAPSRFRQALETTLHGLTEAAQKAQTSADAGLAEGGDNARVLNRAVRLLKEESALRELLQMYRSALYQG